MLGNRLNHSKLRQRRNEPDVNPIESLVNLADCMLVLAVGAMLALVINWNLDIGNPGLSKPKGVDMEQAEEIEGLNNEDIVDITSQAGLQEKGKIYIDPETGKMYMVLSE